MSQMNFAEDVLQPAGQGVEGPATSEAVQSQLKDCNAANTDKGVGFQIAVFSAIVAVICFAVSFFVLKWGFWTSLALYALTGWASFLYVLACVFLLRRFQNRKAH